jgi:hypothetical protein
MFGIQISLEHVLFVKHRPLLQKYTETVLIGKCAADRLHVIIKTSECHSNSKKRETLTGVWQGLVAINRV